MQRRIGALPRRPTHGHHSPPLRQREPLTHEGRGQPQRIRHAVLDIRGGRRLEDVEDADDAEAPGHPPIPLGDIALTEVRYSRDPDVGLNPDGTLNPYVWPEPDPEFVLTCEAVDEMLPPYEGPDPEPE